MAVFQPGVPIKTDQPAITVEKLVPGRHEFELVVFDDQGNASAPDRRVVNVVRTIVRPPRDFPWMNEVEPIARPDPIARPIEVEPRPIEPPVRPDERIVRPIDPRITPPFRRPQG